MGIIDLGSDQVPVVLVNVVLIVAHNNVRLSWLASYMHAYKKYLTLIVL